MISRTRLATAGFLSAILVSIAACGGGTATTAPAVVPTATPTSPAATLPVAPGGTGTTGSVDAATIVTAEMAGTIITGTLTKTNGPGSGTAMSIVLYSNGSGDSVTVLVEQVPSGIGGTMLQAAIQAAGAQGALETISGLGDAAGKAVTGNEATVAFVKGVNLVVIAASASTMAGTDLEPKVEILAHLVAGRL